MFDYPLHRGATSHCEHLAYSMAENSPALGEPVHQPTACAERDNPIPAAALLAKPL